MGKIVEFIEAFKRYYSHFDQCDLSDLDLFYAADIQFSDPLHTINGRDNVRRYFSDMCHGLSKCRFEFVGETLGDDSAWFKWFMHYQHPKLKKGAPLCLTGASYIQFATTTDGVEIVSHEDFYDMGSMVYEHVPVIGFGVNLIKQQLLKS
jgi:hypothetical protein